ncbi:MAG: endo-1,4-beta-xylanase [Thermoguttaceae bacterium]|nr:endo-1,4-beta-xylanase [Thermoguttaceae bacterium]
MKTKKFEPKFLRFVVFSALGWALLLGTLPEPIPPVLGPVGRLLAAETGAPPAGFQGVFNGSFEEDRNADGLPDGWAPAGRRTIVQKLTQFTDPQRGKVARLQCSEFEPGFPDSHVMLAQYDQVAVQRGQWYQVRLWARAEDLETGAVSISLVNRRQWAPVGLEDSFCPTERWEQFTFFFQARENLAAQDSRLAIYFTGTGTLYVDDVEITPVKEFQPQRQPLLTGPSDRNIIPNSSFECGGAGWGCFAPDVPSWGGALFERMGQLDAKQAYHGQHSWRLELRRQQLPISYFDYFDPSAAPLGCVVLAHEGWVPAEVGKRYVFSAYVQADPADLPGLLVIRHADGPMLMQPFKAAGKWTKVEYTFTAQRPFFWAGLGIDLRRSQHPGGRLWIDAVQLREVPAGQPAAVPPTKQSHLSPVRERPAAPKTPPGQRAVLTCYFPETANPENSPLPTAAEGALRSRAGEGGQHSNLLLNTLLISPLLLARMEQQASVAFEKSPRDYQPRETVESAIETDRPGNIFTDPAAGLAFRLRAYNDGRQPAILKGQLTITDYLDEAVWQQPVELTLPPGQSLQKEFTGILPGRLGFFRIRWRPEIAKEQAKPPAARQPLLPHQPLSLCSAAISADSSGQEQSLRSAMIQPYPTSQDSAFGMNHAFSWEFLLRLGHQAGLLWWRDWSCQWRLVQPAPEALFDFSIPDKQILRVLEAGGRVLVLLPFPTAAWATDVDPQKVRAQTGGQDYLFRRTLAAMKPRRMEQFAEYVRQTVRHYKGRITAIEILNEPLYTSYALPQSFGYKTADYIEMLRTAYQAAKEVDPNCLVVGGIGAPPDHRFVREFIEQDGLRWADVMDLHMYPHAGPPDAYEKAYQDCWQRMQARGQAKPIWMTELGIYADDDPAVVPFRAGDASMSRSQRPNELRAAADLVKFAAVLASAGVQKILYHAGTCSAWNESSAGNVFFEYGGAPRKMYAAQAALARLLGPEFTFLGKWPEPAGVQAFRFRTRSGELVILWSRKGQLELPVPAGYQAMDLMGNPIAGRQIHLGTIPVYLVKK